MWSQYYWNSKRFRGTALKQVIDEIGGKVVVLGCPAEEGGENGSAKASYVKSRHYRRYRCCAHGTSR